jgi:hypothetical protein
MAEVKSQAIGNCRTKGGSIDNPGSGQFETRELSILAKISGRRQSVPEFPD